MVLSDNEILELLKDGKLMINPLLDPKTQIQGAKVDLRLDNIFQRIKSEQVTYYDTFPAEGEDATLPTYQQIVVSYSDDFVLHPGEFVLGQTFESVHLPKNIFGHLDGRSSLGRQGIIVHATACGVDPGFAGVLCLELSNAGPIPVVLHPLMRIGAISFEEVSGKVSRTYSRQIDSKFSGSSISRQWSADTEFRTIQETIRI